MSETNQKNNKTEIADRIEDKFEEPLKEYYRIEKKIRPFSVKKISIVRGSEEIWETYL